MFLYSYFRSSEAANHVEDLNTLIKHPGWIIVSNLLYKTYDEFDYDTKVIFQSNSLNKWIPPPKNGIFVTENTFNRKLEETIVVLSGFYALELNVILELLNIFWNDYKSFASPLNLSDLWEHTQKLQNVLIRMEIVMSFFYSMTNKKLFGLDIGKCRSNTYKAVKNFQNLLQSILNCFQGHVGESVANLLDAADQFFYENFRQITDMNGFFIISNINNTVLQFVGPKSNKINFILKKIGAVTTDLIDVHEKLGLKFDENNQIVEIEKTLDN